MYDVNSKNHTQLIGNVGQDVDFSVLEGGRKVANFSVCTNEGYKPDGAEEAVEKAVWHAVSAFGPMAERIEKSGIRAGSRVLIEGRMNYSERTKEVGGVTHVYHNATLIVENSMNLTPPTKTPA